METKLLTITITQDDYEHKRLDKILSHYLPDISRSLIVKYFDAGAFLSSTPLTLKKLPPIGTIISFTYPEPEESHHKAQDIPLDIRFEDEHLLIINKEAGMVVHPAPGHHDGTLVNAILWHCKDLKGIGNEKRPGIVHRLDKGTTGIMVVAKTALAHERLVSMFSKHDLNRQYQALSLSSKLPPEKELTSLIGRSPHNRLKMTTKIENGKTAVTKLKVLEFFSHASHVELTLETGRTHQIRVHLSELLNAPIINDSLYGNKNQEKNHLSSVIKSHFKNYEHPFLHAKLLEFNHPITNEFMSFKSDPPIIFQKTLDELRNEII